MTPTASDGARARRLPLQRRPVLRQRQPVPRRRAGDPRQLRASRPCAGCASTPARSSTSTTPAPRRCARPHDACAAHSVRLSFAAVLPPVREELERVRHRRPRRPRPLLRARRRRASAAFEPDGRPVAAPAEPGVTRRRRRESSELGDALPAGPSQHRHDRRVASRDQGTEPMTMPRDTAAMTANAATGRTRHPTVGRSAPPPAAPPAPRRRARRTLPGQAAPDREPAMTTLQRQAETRVAELVPIRYGRMVASPFAFYRGAAAIMAADLAAVAAHRARGAAVRRRPPLQLRRASRHPIAGWCSASTTSTRPSRPVRVGRQAARRQLRHRRAAAGLQRRGSGARS